MVKRIYIAVYAIARPGGKTVRAGEQLELSDEDAERLLSKSAVAAMPQTDDSTSSGADLLALPDAEFESALTSMKLAELKATVVSLSLEAGEAKTKADFVAVIQDARESTGQQSGT